MAEGRGRPPVAATLTLLLSLGVSVPGLLRAGPAARSAASLRPAALRSGEVHRLVTYIFVYEDLISLTCGAIIIWYFAGSFEKNVGTVKHCFLTIAFAVLSALLFLLLETIVLRVTEVEDAKGFMPVAFAMLGVSTTRSQMKRTLFFGVRVPVMLVPWFMLCIAWFIPHSSLLSNLCGLLTGEAYGLGYCFCLDFPESVGSKLDRVFPFSLLKRIPGLKYIPGSLAERRALESSKCSTPVFRARGFNTTALQDTAMLWDTRDLSTAMLQDTASLLPPTKPEKPLESVTCRPPLEPHRASAARASSLPHSVCARLIHRRLQVWAPWLGFRKHQDTQQPQWFLFQLNFQQSRCTDPPGSSKAIIQWQDHCVILQKAAGASLLSQG
ncbi:rhomboid domain-containing protein 2 [Tyto alba]|uniref:rhomboid domain-containing protein 2 n=1 Tax=Tyto alba TaxID=56313 RepID=UPI001C676D73|nr:rhomboid domain-containing protein 2 [Tyto alba]